MQKTISEQFLLRTERYKKLLESKRVPNSSSQAYIVPCLKRTLGFKSNQYAKNSQKLEQYIDGETFENFVGNANQIINKELNQKQKNQTATFFCMTSLILKISIAIGFVTFTLLAVIVYFDFPAEQEKNILYASIVLIFFSVVIGSICPIYLYLRKYKQYDYEAAIYQELVKLANKQNEKYKKQGKEHIQWHFEKSFFWIQFRIIREKVKVNQRKLIFRFVQDQEHEHDSVNLNQ